MGFGIALAAQPEKVAQQEKNSRKVSSFAMRLKPAAMGSNDQSAAASKPTSEPEQFGCQQVDQQSG